MNKTLVISPSGNFYGSEQVLFDHLKSTKLRFDVMLPVNSMFYELASKETTSHRILEFNEKKLKKFYLRLFLQLLAGRYDTVYVNEAGHSRYVMLLAKVFRSKRFVIHVRIAEDTDVSRWKSLPTRNTQLISVSENIEQKLPYPSERLYDLYIFTKKSEPPLAVKARRVLHVGIIGRISYSKGLPELAELLDYIEKSQPGTPYKFKMYGHIPAELSNDPMVQKLKTNENVELMGFVKSKKDIYDNIDIVLHLSRTEPLGRIFLEAIDEKKPFIGFNSAGIGEIGKLTRLDGLLCDPANKEFAQEIYAKLEDAKNNYPDHIAKIEAKKEMAATIFSAASYTSKLDSLLE